MLLSTGLSLCEVDVAGAHSTNTNTFNYFYVNRYIHIYFLNDVILTFLIPIEHLTFL